MKLTKVLTGTTLAFGLLVSAAPVFAASHTSEPVAHPAAKYINCPSDLPNSFKNSNKSSKCVKSSSGVFSNVFTVSDGTWYFKGKFYSDVFKTYVGFYEGN
ncbi:LCI cystabiotic [Bacillus glycinifermentans]|uniref:LCI fold-containing protein n=1 Tax=Bacillus glycinifermentans TaxID=1664069 RepID=UPI000652D9D9|nr:LCI fold-containing protein [Bacillus glycinifermentans]KMM54374.1 LCI cystabiotic [Bacillus glycinifermentans]MEC0495968.1 LCI family antimicrobial peptide [Bacillus glycinifermentans]MEC0539087.1 LCI family antimicrobial peptide [Bacillus glycinifermentans]